MLSEKEKYELLSFARATLVAHLSNQPLPVMKSINPNYLQKQGIFVSLHCNDELRGCMGCMESDQPLDVTLQRMAVIAAVNDPRFDPLHPDELEGIIIEISVLSPRKIIQTIEEIIVGHHGLIVTQGFYKGVLLPQVPVEYGWDREKFLSHTCQKAGLSMDAWKEDGITIEIFSAEVFKENS